MGIRVTAERTRWRAEATLRVDIATSGPWLLPTDEPVTIGRGPTCGLQVDHAGVSVELATMRPTELGWVLRNGQRTRVSANSVFVLGGSFAPRAQILLQPADWRLTWDLDVLCELRLQIRPDTGFGERYPVARDTGSDHRAALDPRRLIGTAVGGEKLTLTPLQRRRLGALFAYLINGEPKPERLLGAAAELSGDSIPQINNAWVKVMRKVNDHRHGNPIEHIEDLGYYLVEVAGVLGPDDVPRPQPGVGRYPSRPGRKTQARGHE